MKNGKVLQVEYLTTCLPSTLQQHGLGDGGHICSRYCISEGMPYTERDKLRIKAPLSYSWGISILLYI